MLNKLSKNDVEDLKRRIKNTKVSGETQKEIAEEYNISRQTLLRYINPEYRKLSRTYLKVTVTFLACPNCHKPLEGHPRCKRCEIYIHPPNEENQFRGRMATQDLCTHCIDTF